MDVALAVVFALAFAATNGLHDAANAIATLVATRGATPGRAITMSAALNLLGALVFGTAVAATIAGLISVPASDGVAVIGAGAFAATAWNIGTWSLGLPTSSGHALVGGLVGAAVASSGTGAIVWGGFHGLHPYGVGGVLVALAVAPFLGFTVALLALRALTWLLRRATRRFHQPVRWGEWAMSALLSFSHGTNDAQKSMGLIAAVLLAAGRTETLTVPLWAKLACGVTLTVGTALGGWRIIRTVGLRIFHLTPLDGLASQTASAGVIFSASAVGAPVPTTQVVASSVIGVGAGRRRWRHVRWEVVRAMVLAWLLTLPGAAVLGALSLAIWEAAR